MERYTLNLKLPKIVQLTEPSPCKSERIGMISRNVFMHTATGCVVEVLLGTNFIFEKEYVEYIFGENPKHTAILLSKPLHISDEDGMEAIQTIAKWFLRHYEEFSIISSMDWGMM